MRGWRATVAVASVLACSQACSDPAADPPEAEVAWTARTLPEHPGAPGRTVVRDAVRCDDAWFVVGAVFLDRPTETRDTRPAAWVSRDDGVTFDPVAVETDTYWGRRAILNSVACSRDRVAVVGARSGGAHGNPRVTTFHLDGRERLVDVLAVFTQFGGVSATNVGPISGGPEGWLIAGNRLSGPGVWVSDDPRGFTRVEGEAGLTEDGDLESLAQAGAWDGEGWVLVGAGAPEGELLDRDPLAWTSPDGLAWRTQPMPSGAESEDVHRVVGLPDGSVLAVGATPTSFRSWLRTDDGWGRAVPFADVADDWRGAPYVASLVPQRDGALATLSDGSGYQLWHTADGSRWRRVAVPAAPTTAGDHTLAVAADGDAQLLLLADDGDGARVWTGSMD